jgi:undecaprenyl-diphosphatase
MPVAPAEVRPRTRFGARAVLAAVALLLVAVPFGLLLFFVEDKWPPLQSADTGARDGLHRYAVESHTLVTVFKVLSTIGGTVSYLVVFAVVALYLLRRGLRRLALFVVVTVVGSSLLNLAVKTAVHRSRPVLPDPVAHANGLSFPSGHAQAAIVAYSVLLLVFLPALRGAWRVIAVTVAVLMVLLIGLARIGLGVHYLSDVLAGYVLGAAWVAAMTAAFSAWRRERGRPPVDPKEGLAPEDAERLKASPS